MNKANKRKSRLREYTVRFVLVISSILFCLLIVEVALRVMMPREIMRYFFVTSDPVLHHRFIPHAGGRYQSTEFDTHYRINSLGLRDREISEKKPEGTIRILMLGDSFTEGDGVESDQTFSKQLEGILAGHSTPFKCEVINAGVGSYSPILEYLYLKHDGLALEPDLVILNFDLSDVHDDIQYTMLATLDVDGTPLAVAPSGPQRDVSWHQEHLIGIKDFVKHNTRLYNVIRIRIDRYLEGVRGEGNYSGDIRYDKYAMLRENYDHDKETHWKLSFKYILLIRDLVRESGADFWITVYPYAHQVSRKEWEIGRQFWGFKQDTVYSSTPQKIMERFGSRHDIKVVNTYHDFQIASEDRFPLYWPDNGHWVPEGHSVVARALVREVLPYLKLTAEGRVTESMSGYTVRQTGGLTE